MALGFAGIAESALVEIGTVAFKSFGEYVKRAGESETTRSYGLNGGLFYSRPRDDGSVTISPSMRCIYLVRDGHGPKSSPFDESVPDATRQSWVSRGVKRTPAFYAALRIETAGEL
ncbi:MAG: hypothetical protein AAFY15_13275, partial [Cyanobacteria bacterium J06648_11]